MSVALVTIHLDHDNQVLRVQNIEGHEIPHIIQRVAPVQEVLQSIDALTVDEDEDMSNWDMSLLDPSQDTMCNYCGKDGANSSCNKCGHALYCNAQCQHNDWAKGHEELCDKVCEYVENLADELGVKPNEVLFQQRRLYRQGLRLISRNGGRGRVRRRPGVWGPGYRPYYRGRRYPNWYFTPVIPTTILTLAALRLFLGPRRYGLYSPYWRYNFSTRGWMPRYNPKWDPYTDEFYAY